MTDCEGEFPKDWYTKAKLNPIKYDKNLNYFKVKASQSLAEWRKKGWIHQDDPRGWFQWYCRYYMGRRHADDARQINRWQKMTRHVIWLQNGCGVAWATFLPPPPTPGITTLGLRLKTIIDGYLRCYNIKLCWV